MAPILKPLLARFLPPIFFNTRLQEEISAQAGTAQMNHIFPQPTWTFAKKNGDGNTMPQVIGHRGYNAAYAENTMSSFKGAVDVGADAIETDIHLTKDGVVVLSHDPTLARCFGQKDKIMDCNWEDISKLRTLKEPHEPMPRLEDLLTYLTTPGLEDIWLLLDIKIDDDAETLMRLIAQTISSVPASASKPWEKRIVLGIWGKKYLPLAATYLPEFACTHIGFSTTRARGFLRHPHVSFNLLQQVLYCWPLGSLFIRAARAHNRSILAWTVNDDPMMRWCINKGIDGVITDDPKQFAQVRQEWVQGRRDVRLEWRTLMAIWTLRIVAAIFGIYVRLRFEGLGMMPLVKQPKKVKGGAEAAERQRLLMEGQ